MMGWLFGGSKAADTVVEAVSSSVKGVGTWIDEQQFTEEEQAVHKAKLVDQHLEFLKVAYDQNSIRSVTRRIMAWAIVFNILALANLSAYYAVSGDTTAVDAIVNIVRSFWLGESFLAVIGFYFGIQFLRGDK